METTPMPKNADLHDMDWWCTNCGGEGEIPFSDSKTCEPVFVICSHCSYPSAYGWCEKCGVGTQLEWIDFRQRPLVWHCDGCGTEYKLPVDFYENPVRFQPEAFADVEKIREIRFIREYGHVNVTWLRRGFLFWDKIRNVPLILACVLLLLLGLLGSVFQLSAPPWLGIVALFLLIIFGVAILMDVITFLVSKIFLVMYKISKKWNE